MSSTTITAAPSRAPAVGAKAPPKLFGIDSRFVAPIFITLILLVGQLTYGILESYAMTALAIVTAIALELVLGRLLVGKWPHLASAYISGISVGILTRSPYLALRAVQRHLDHVEVRAPLARPAHLEPLELRHRRDAAHRAVGLLDALSVQWGNNLWPMLVIWALGAVITYHVGRIHITATYVVSFFALSYVRCLVTGHSYWAEAAPITGPMYQLFIFFMITDPKTTVRSSKWAQAFVGFLVALAEMFLRLAENVHAPYYALFIVGPAANLFEIYLTSRRAKAVN